MQFKSIKNATELPFRGVELVKVDGAITEVIIGSKLRIRKGESYAPGLVLLVEAPFESVKRHRVTATVEGFDPKVMHFEDSYSAQEAQRDYERKGAETSCEEVSVMVNDGGEFVAAPPQTDIEEIPF